MERRYCICNCGKSFRVLRESHQWYASEACEIGLEGLARREKHIDSTMGMRNADKSQPSRAKQRSSRWSKMLFEEIGWNKKHKPRF